MAERLDVSQRMQLGVETTPGVPVAATMKMQSLKAVPRIMTSTESFVASGYKFPSVVAIDEEWTECDLTGPGNFNEFPYLFAGLLVAPSAPAVIAGGFSWTFQPAFDNPDTTKTYTIEIGDPFFGERFAGGQFTDGTWTFTRKGITFKGKLIGQLFQKDAPITMGPAASSVQTITIGGVPTGGTFSISYRGAVYNAAYNITTVALQTALAALSSIGTGNVTVTGTAGTSYVITFASALANMWIEPLVVDGGLLTGGTLPTATVAQTTAGSGAAPITVPLIPQTGNQVDVFLDTSYAQIGSSLMPREFTLDWGITGKYGPLWPMRTDLTSYAATPELLGKSAIKMLLEADNNGKTWITSMRGAQTLYLRVRVTGGTLGAGTKYLMTCDMPIRITSPDAFVAQEGVRAIPYNAEIMADPTAGYPVKITMQNALTAL